MGIFDFFRKKKQTQKNDIQSVKSNKKIDKPEIKKDIKTQKEGYIELGEICLNESN